MKYYKVTAKCGHVGNGMICIKNFYVKSKSKKEARNLVRTRPRVKKGMKNCIVDVHRITYEAFIEGKKEWHDDPYFRCRSPEDMLKAKNKGYKQKKIKLPGRFDGKTFVRKPQKYKKLNYKQSEDF